MEGKHTIRQWRALKEMSVEGFADALGVSRQTAYRYERHPEQLNIMVASQIASLFGTNLEGIIYHASSFNENVDVKQDA